MGVIVNDVAVDILDDALKNKLAEVAVELVDVKLATQKLTGKQVPKSICRL